MGGEHEAILRAMTDYHHALFAWTLSEGDREAIAWGLAEIGRLRAEVRRLAAGGWVVDGIDWEVEPRASLVGEIRRLTEDRDRLRAANAKLEARLAFLEGRDSPDCEHGIPIGDWCPDCNRESKAARAANGD
ncbi:unnamed protein product [uncultured bacterium]|nr:unnamed protein product [uncultured bacterium]